LTDYLLEIYPMTYLRIRRPNPIQNDRNLDFVLEQLIFEVLVIRRERHKSRKVLKTMDFYVSIRCIPITHSTWLQFKSDAFSVTGSPVIVTSIRPYFLM
jgi:hypothetical protein